MKCPRSPNTMTIANNSLADRHAARRFEHQIRAATAHHRWSTLEVETPAAGCVAAATVDPEAERAADQEHLLALERADEAPAPVNPAGYRRWFPSGASETPCLVPPPLAPVLDASFNLRHVYPNLFV